MCDKCKCPDCGEYLSRYNEVKSKICWACKIIVHDELGIIR